MKSYNSRELLKHIRKNGWVETGISRGSHRYMVNPDKPELGKVTIPLSSVKETPKYSLVAFWGSKSMTTTLVPDFEKA